jgi:CheY-like chemotaxis protein
MAKRILIIDDEPAIQEVTQICLQTVAGWQVITAGSGPEGILKAAAYQPDVILLDVMMPEMDGFTTFQKLQANASTQEIPVLLLTAQVQASDDKRHSTLGIRGTISKPFDPLELAQQVAQTLGWESISSQLS